MATPFKIGPSYDGFTPSPELQQAVEYSVQRWSDIVKAWPTGAGGFQINELRLHIVKLTHRSGPEGTLAFTDPKKLQCAPASAGALAHLPVDATIAIDLVDVPTLHLEARLFDTVKHEMAHALGLGTVWKEKGLIHKEKEIPFYIGARAVGEYATLAGDSSIKAVPLERRGDQFTVESHWRGDLFPAEVLNGEVGREMWISRITLGALQDLGYEVDLREADFYRLPA